ncbi:MAG: acyl-CoA dehydrogenase [Flammeovirgaceae bacterium]
MKTPRVLFPTKKKYDENILEGISFFLPILYVAWSDSILTEKEIHAIKEQSNGDKWKWLTASEREWIERWLNPAHPPSSVDLKNWLVIINRSVAKIEVDKRMDLAQLGTAMAQVSLAGAAKKKAKEDIYNALVEIQHSLGVIGTEAADLFIDRPKAKDQIKSRIDPIKLNEILDGSYHTIIQQVKQAISSEAFKLQHFTDKVKHRDQVYEWCNVLAGMGFGNMGYPKAFGGQADLGGYFAVMETLSYHDLSLVIKFGVQFGLWGMSVMFLGTEKHHKKYLEKIGTLEIPGCFAMTETGHGSNVQGLETTATYDHQHQEFIIHTPHETAAKEYIGNAALHGRMATVFAKLVIDEVDFGVSAFVVPIRDENGHPIANVRIEDCGDKLGLNGVDNGKIWFNQVRIPKSAMLDRFSSVDENGYFQSDIASDGKRFFTMLGTLVGGRVGIPRSGLSAAKKGLYIAIKYGDQRKQFGPAGKPEVSILNYQTHQRKLMPLLANAYAYHFALNYLTQRFLSRSEEDAREVETLAAGLKATATWNTTHTLQTCREACGGKGYLAENMFADLKADSDIYTTFEGDNTVLMQLVAKSLLTDFRQEFHDMTLFSIVRFVAERAELTITEKNPIIIRNTDRNHLLDEEYHLSLFKNRERDQLIDVAKRLQKLMKEEDSFTAFNQCQQELVELAHSHIHTIIVEQFAKAIATLSLKEASERRMLKKLYQLFVIHQLHEGRAWFLENDYMEGKKAKAIETLLSELCADVRTYAVDLVEAFQIPKSCLPDLVK